MHRPDVFFFQYAAQVRQVCAPPLAKIPLRYVAEQLERCYFDEVCEQRLCRELHGPDEPQGWRYEDPRWRPAVLGPRPWARGALRPAGQEYGEPIPAPPSAPSDRCHNECGRKHCEDWLRCGSAYPGNYATRERCRKRVGKEHEQCHKRCDPGIG